MITIEKHCSFPTGYFNNNKKSFSLLHINSLLFLFIFLSFSFFPRITEPLHNLLIFHFLMNQTKLQTQIPKSYSNFSQNNKNRYLHLYFTHWFEINGVVAEAHLVEEARAALGDGGGLIDLERPALISVGV
jgi:hypothetical protein